MRRRRKLPFSNILFCKTCSEKVPVCEVCLCWGGGGNKSVVKKWWEGGGGASSRVYLSFTPARVFFQFPELSPYPKMSHFLITASLRSFHKCHPLFPSPFNKTRFTIRPSTPFFAADPLISQSTEMAGLQIPCWGPSNTTRV